MFCFRTHCRQIKIFEKHCMNLRKTVHMLKWARLNIPISEEQLNYHFCSFRKLEGGQKLISQNLEVRLHPLQIISALQIASGKSLLIKN